MRSFPEPGSRPPAFWDGLGRIVHRFGPVNRALLQRRDELQAKIDDWHRNKSRTPVRSGRLQGVPERDRLSRARRPGLRGRHRECRRRNRHDRRPAARGAGDECALCAQCRQCALGLALRRALRHRRDPETTAPTAAKATIRSAASKVIAWARDFLDQRAPLASGSHATRPRYAVGDGSARGHARRPAPRPALRRARAIRGYRGRCRTRPTPCCCVNNGLHIEIVIDRTPPDRPRRSRPALPTSCSNPRSRPSWTAKIRSPPSMPRTRSAAIATGSA